MRNLVLGLAKGYTFGQLRPFVASLRLAGYRGDICLLYSDLSAETLEALRAYDVELVPVDETSVNLGFKRTYLYQLLNRIHALPLGPTHRAVPAALQILSGGNNVRHARLAMKFVNKFCLRYPAYLIYLAGRRYENVMISDVRDVIFQGDPFGFDTEGKLCLMLEDARTPIKDCGFNSEWIRRGFGGDVLGEIGDRVPSCSGVTVGGYDAMMSYLETMTRTMVGLRHFMFGIDQGVHNYLYHAGRLEDVRAFENGRGPVLTMGSIQDKPYRFDAEGRLLNADGTLPAVLHQYDRHVDNGLLVMDSETFRLSETRNSVSAATSR